MVSFTLCFFYGNDVVKAYNPYFHGVINLALWGSWSLILVGKKQGLYHLSPGGWRWKIHPFFLMGPLKWDPCFWGCLSSKCMTNSGWISQKTSAWSLVWCHILTPLVQEQSSVFSIKHHKTGVPWFGTPVIGLSQWMRCEKEEWEWETTEKNVTL